MKYLAVLGRQPELSLAELTALFGDSVRQISPALAVFESDATPSIDRLGGALKLARLLSESPLDYLKQLPEGKITLGLSDYSQSASAKAVRLHAMKLKKILKRHGRSVRILDNKSAVLSTATSHHNQLGQKANHIEFILVNKEIYLVIGVQNITAYARRDQARPARDAKVGMLPPKLAQILINLCGPLPTGSRLLDPFCGTGVLLQEALLMGYTPYGTDLSPRMVDYAKKNLTWLSQSRQPSSGGALRSLRASHRGATPATAGGRDPGDAEDGLTTLTASNAVRKRMVSTEIIQGDATVFTWHQPIDAIACETYLGPPMSTPPSEIRLKEAQHECRDIILGFLKNLAPQVKTNTPIALAVPAWLRPSGQYSTLNILDEIKNLGYNVIKYNNSSRDPLLYHREGQIVAREIIVLRKK